MTSFTQVVLNHKYNFHQYKVWPALASGFGNAAYFEPRQQIAVSMLFHGSEGAVPTILDMHAIPRCAICTPGI